MLARSAELLVRQTGVTVLEWNERVRTSGADRNGAELRVWLTQQQVTGYAQQLLVMERFGYPDFLITNADEQLIDRNIQGASISVPSSTRYSRRQTSSAMAGSKRVKATFRSSLHATRSQSFGWSPRSEWVSAFDYLTVSPPAGLKAQNGSATKASMSGLDCIQPKMWTTKS